MLQTDSTLPGLEVPDLAHARRSDPWTSHEAAVVASERVSDSHRVVLALLREAARPVAAVELERLVAARSLSLSSSRVRSALPELERKDLVRRAGSVRFEGERTARTLWEVAS